MENSKNPKISLCVNSHEVHLCHWGPAIQVLVLLKWEFGDEVSGGFRIPKAVEY